MKSTYTVILRRSNWLMDILDGGADEELYVANPDTPFATLQDAAIAAKQEAAKADLGDVKSILHERGLGMRAKTIDPDHYKVIMVFEGRPVMRVSGPEDLEVAAINRGCE